MRRILLMCFALSALLGTAFLPAAKYEDGYLRSISELVRSMERLATRVQVADLNDSAVREEISAAIAASRMHMKAVDPWIRYFDPVQYLRVNGQLPVEWETEVFEKFEKPYRREGAGLSLAFQYLRSETPNKDSLYKLVQNGIDAVRSYRADSNLSQLADPAHFFFMNRLFLLNLAAIYTTGYECPDDATVIPELKHLLRSMGASYTAYNLGHQDMPVLPEFMDRFTAAIRFVNEQPEDANRFDHYHFIRDHVGPLFALNVKMMGKYRARSARFNDFTLVDTASSIFSKSLYMGQHTKGIFSLVDDPEVLSRVREVGRKLFYDPILSGNGQRTCASCHKQSMYFADTLVETPLQYDRTKRLPRSALSLLNAPFHHLIMQDGRHLTLQEQAKVVILSPIEMNGGGGVVDRVLSCPEYRTVFQDLLRHTPEEEKITLDHIASTITYYYGGFSDHLSPFDEAMNGKAEAGDDVVRGFNLFMGKARCATCHFAPQFNGVKPPYVSSEFEVLGVPTDTTYRRLSPDSGRHLVHPVPEMLNAFRTPTLRNIAHTAPYMHNGSFPTLGSVLEFYNAGGGVGHGLSLRNQTLESDSLHLGPSELKDLTSFMHALTENIPFEEPPTGLPRSRNASLNGRKIGGEY